MKPISPGGYYAASLAAICLINIGVAWDLRRELATSARVGDDMRDAFKTLQATVTAELTEHTDLIRQTLRVEGQSRIRLTRLTDFIFQQHPEYTELLDLEQRVQALEHP